MIFGDPTQQLLERLNRDGAKATRKDLHDALAICIANKPSGFDAEVAGARDRYLGNGGHFTRRRLLHRYPRSGSKIPTVTTNWLYMMACNDATVYANGVVRNVSSDETFTHVLQSSGIDETMTELEKRLHACGSQWISADYDALGNRVSLALHWPDTVHAIAHHSRPNQIDYCYMLIAEVSGPGKAQWFDLWVRSYTETDSGGVESFGLWKRHRVNANGESAYRADSDAANYNGNRLPWCLAVKGRADFGLLAPVDVDMLDQIDDINALASDQQYVLGLQGHTPIVYKGTGIKNVADIAFGPDSILDSPNGDWTTLSLNPKLLEMRQAREQRVQELAISHRQPSDAYNPQGAPLSGASRRIANIPAERQRQEMALAFEHFEEKQLLPVIANVYNSHSFGLPVISEPIEASVSFNAPSEYEDSQTVQRKLIEAKDAGMISPARCAVESGYYKTIADAAEAGLSDKLQVIAESDIPLFGSELGG